MQVRLNDWAVSVPCMQSVFAVSLYYDTVIYIKCYIKTLRSQIYLSNILHSCHTRMTSSLIPLKNSLCCFLIACCLSWMSSLRVSSLSTMQILTQQEILYMWTYLITLALTKGNLQIKFNNNTLLIRLYLIIIIVALLYFNICRLFYFLLWIECIILTSYVSDASL